MLDPQCLSICTETFTAIVLIPAPPHSVWNKNSGADRTTPGMDLHVHQRLSDGSDVSIRRGEL